MLFSTYATDMGKTTSTVDIRLMQIMLPPVERSGVSINKSVTTSSDGTGTGSTPIFDLGQELLVLLIRDHDEEFSYESQANGYDNRSSPVPIRRCNNGDLFTTSIR